MTNIAELTEIDRRHWLHPVVALQQHEKRGATIWDSADGIHLTDVNGRRVQDAFSGLWCVSVGYGQQSVDAAHAQMRKLPYATGYFHFASEPAIRLAGRLVSHAPKGLTRVLFGQGGSDAVDTAIRSVRYFFNATGRPHKKHFIGLERGYHGSSAAGSGLTALPLFHRYFDVPIPPALANTSKRKKELEQLPCVGEVRIRGMLAAVELVADKKTKAKPAAALRMGQRVLDLAFENGLVFRASGDDILGFAPSLNYTEADIDVLVDRVRASISHVFS